MKMGGCSMTIYKLHVSFGYCTYHVLREHLSEHLRMLVRPLFVSLHVQLWEHIKGLRWLFKG
jgi:hypothetical protein